MKFKPLAIVLALLAPAALIAHDLFLKPAQFFVKPGGMIHVHVINGTFTESAGNVDPARLRDLLVVGNGAPAADRTTWDTAKKESQWHVRTGSAGTYLLAASLLPRTLKLPGKDFNSYLAEDGLPDVLAARKAQGRLDEPSNERYSKHVKALVQVGDVRAGKIDTVLGYPAELIPLDNPYSLKVGKSLRVRALVDGKPVANQVVLAGGRGATGARINQQTVRTDANGDARIALTRAGVWYVKFINMRHIAQPVADSVNYESKWATLTFAIR